MKNEDKKGDSGDAAHKAPSVEMQGPRNCSSEDRLRRLIDLSPDMMCLAASDGYFRDVNPAFEDALGWSREELLSQSYFDFVHPDDIEPTQTALQSLAKGHEVVDFENRWRSKDGSYRWLQWRATPGDDVAYAVARDVTEVKQTAEEFRKSEERYRLLVESARDILFEADADGYFTFANCVAVEVTGYTEEVIRGMHFLKLVHPDARQEAERFYAVQLREKTPSTYYEFPMRTRDGRVVWLGQHVQLVETSDGSQRVHAVARDITERKRAEDELAKSNATIRALLESASQAVLAVDMEGNIVFFNPMVEQMFGYTGYELAQMKVDTLLPGHLREQHVEHRALFFADPRVRPMGKGREVWADRKDGSQIPLEVSLSHIDSPEGILAVIFATDITERRRIRRDRHKQEQMTALADGLLQGQEEERRRVARELHDSVGQDLATVSVELGTLIREAGDEGYTVREELIRLREKIVALSEGIRNLSHRLHPAELEALGLLSALRSLGDRLFKYEGIRAYILTDDEPLNLPASSAVAIYRVVQEALRNIAKHSGAKEVTVTLERDEDRLRLSIVDHGVGFDAEGIGGKAGLGLVSMEERMRLLGGSFEIRSKPGEGTEVEAFVPMPKEES
jgi:PAS domain S-box-containing protein